MHQITTRKGFTGPRRRRAGIEVAQGATVEVELTEAQLDAVTADPELVVVAIKEGEEASLKSTQPTKAELVAQAEVMGLSVPRRATVAQLEELIASTSPAEPTAEEVSTEDEEVRDMVDEQESTEA